MPKSLTPVVLNEVSTPGTPATGTAVLYAKTDGKIYSKDDTGVESLLTDSTDPYVFFMSGTLTTKVGALRIYFEAAHTVESVRASVGTAPTGATVLVDVNRNGTTIYTTQTNRPTIAISGFTATGGAAANGAFAAGDYMTCDVDQIGSTVAGADLTVVVRMRRTG